MQSLAIAGVLLLTVLDQADASNDQSQRLALYQQAE
jgi:hypothetical protein